MLPPRSTSTGVVATIVIPVTTPAPRPTEPARHRRGRRWLLAAGAALVAVVAAGLALTLRDNARPVTVDEARERTTSTSPGVDDDAAVRPAAGVYRYEGTGTEELSTPPLSQSQGPTMPATVEWLDDGCWSFRIDYSSNHWQSWDYCPEGDVVAETSGSTWQRWMIGATAITNLSTFDCEPGSVVVALDAAPDDEWQGRCTGTNEAISGETVSQGPDRFVGEEVVEVDGVGVRTQHFVSERTMSGAQVGTDRSDVWFQVGTGLPVRNRRSISAATDTPVGSSTYTEVGEFQLAATEAL